MEYICNEHCEIIGANIKGKFVPIQEIDFNKVNYVKKTIPHTVIGDVMEHLSERSTSG